MSKGHRTPGNWYVSGELKNQVKTDIVPHGEIVANINPLNTMEPEEAAATARLIAAAPELLDVLETFVAWANIKDWNDSVGLRDRALNIIKQAK